MNRHDFLTGLHGAYAPRGYLEIGINDGRGLARSRARTIGVDPAYTLTAELACDLQLVRATSDDFFARDDAMSWYADGLVDLAFVDGMHVFEFALRDFMNTERCSSPTGVIVLDDMLPRSDAEAARDRHTVMWTGDVYKVALVLERYRPDLVVVPVDTVSTGVLLVVGLDPASTVLRDHYDEIVAEYATLDPQSVPSEVLHRKAAADPVAVLASPVWADLVAARDASEVAPDLAPLRALRGSADYTWRAPDDLPWPKKKARPKKAAHARKKSAPAKRPAVPSTPPTFVRRVRNAIKRRL
jgi:Methyltransferase domain